MHCTRLVYLTALATLVACNPGTDVSDKDTDSDTDTVDTDTVDTDTVDTDTVDTDTVDTDTVDTDTVDTDETDTVETDDTDTVDTDLPDTDTDTDLPVAPGELMITEVGDNPNPSVLKWVEIWNPGPDPILLDGFSIDFYANGSSSMTDQWMPGPGIMIDPGEVKVIGAANLHASDYTLAFGVYAAPDDYSSAIDGNGNDTYVLSYLGRPMDIYGEVGVNGATEPWFYSDSVVWRDPMVVHPNTTWTQGEWIFSTSVIAGTGLLEDQSIGAHPPGAIDTDIAEESDRDTYESRTEYDTYETDLIDSDPPTIVTIDTLQAGDLVITEFMANPGECDDSRGEYIEFVSLVNDILDIDGLQIQNATTNQTITISGSILVPPGTTMLAHLDSGSPLGDCYGLGSVGAPYTSLELGNAGGVLRLRNATTIIDQVDYTGWSQLREGYAMELSEDATDATLNNSEDNWCRADRVIVGAFDFGSPTSPNDNCVVDTDTDTDTDTDSDYVPPDTDTDTDTDTDPFLFTVDDLAVGDLVLTEFMVDASTPCADPDGEYVELHNVTSSWVDLAGLVLSSNNGSATISGRAWVPPDGVFVLFRPTAIPRCFPISWPFPSFRSAPYDPTVTFANTGDVVRIANSTTTLDTVDYSGWTPMFLRGSAWSLERAVADDPVANDLQPNWCLNGQQLGIGNIGTVGLLVDCAEDSDTDTN
ncbi:MAG: lamin tail domain-containing protein [Alphaproteobacteria bacterium]|nr:lamin tail domain-containing protein [Alphaproteobacteria bacterium]